MTETTHPPAVFYADLTDSVPQLEVVIMIQVSPSILSADFANLERDLSMLEECGADMAHVDVMDGHFVPNLTIGAPVVKALRKVTKLPLDVHLMISDPDRYLDDFLKAGSDYITIHEECNAPIRETLERIRSAGVKASLSIKPNTPVSVLEEYLPILDMVLIMTVEPGFGGQSFIPFCMEKIKETREMIDRINPKCLLEIDGGVTVQNAPDCIRAGAEVLVAGSAVFGASDRAEAIAAIRGR